MMEYIELILNAPVTPTIGKLLLASFLGALIGLERDIHGRSAGLRTHLLVSMGATLFILISQSVMGADPSRIAAQVVSGIGFLGAGAIMKEGITVRGLTTASCLWIVAGIGMAVGTGQVTIAIATTLISLFALSFLNNFDRFFKRDSYRILSITLPTGINSESLVNSIKSKNLTILFVDYEHHVSEEKCVLRISLRIAHRGNTDSEYWSIYNRLMKEYEGITRINWHHGKIN